VASWLFCITKTSVRQKVTSTWMQSKVEEKSAKRSTSAKLMRLPSSSSLRGAQRRGNPDGDSVFWNDKASGKAVWIATGLYGPRNDEVGGKRTGFPPLWIAPLQ
jgi:hypothetical protein